MHWFMIWVLTDYSFSKRETTSHLTKMKTQRKKVEALIRQFCVMTKQPAVSPYLVWVFAFLPLSGMFRLWVGKVLYAPRLYSINSLRLSSFPYSTDTPFSLRLMTLNKLLLLSGISYSHLMNSQNSTCPQGLAQITCPV